MIQTAARCGVEDVIAATLANYKLGDPDLRMAAMNFLRYGMGGHPIQVGAPQSGFCDNQNMRQNPGEVPREDLPHLMERLEAALRVAGYGDFAERIRPYLVGDFDVFDPGQFRRGD